MKNILSFSACNAHLIAALFMGISYAGCAQVTKPIPTKETLLEYTVISGKGTEENPYVLVAKPTGNKQVNIYEDAIVSELVADTKWYIYNGNSGSFYVFK